MQGVKFTAEEIAAKKAAMLAYLHESAGGTVSLACEHVCVNRTTAYEWMREDVQFKVDIGKAREAATENGLDAAETALMQAIKSGNIAGIIFYLKTIGRPRGFIEKVALAGDRDNPIQVNHVHDAERTAFAIIESLADAKAGIRQLPPPVDTNGTTGTDTPVDQSGMGGVADTGGPGMGQDTHGR